MLTNTTLYHVIYSVRYYPRFHVTVIGLRTYYPRIQESACTYTEWHKKRELLKTPTNLKKSKKKNLLTEIEPLQLAF